MSGSNVSVRVISTDGKKDELAKATTPVTAGGTTPLLVPVKIGSHVAVVEVLVDLTGLRDE